MRQKEPRGAFSLEVPLDATGIENFKPESPVKVAVVNAKGGVTSQIVKLDTKGLGAASFKFDQHPGALRVMVGPGDATDDEIIHLQTLTREIPSRALPDRDLRLPPILIPPFYWWWWLRWCRIFTITGRVLCPDGSPVPGATVCAYDVDWWWWWSSLQQVGCAVTDANGAFVIRFRWCCGWWPWWWWRLRYWQLDPGLLDKIRAVLERIPGIKIPIPSPRPTLDIFEEMLVGQPVQLAGSQVNLAALPGLRDQLLARLPSSADLANLRLWPWWPWQPWWDCAPDIIFKVTQNCQGQERVIVDEQVWDTRWDISTNETVTLTANDEACCIHEPPPPEGDCLVISSVCDDLLNRIGGNPGAAPAPVGYLNPGVIATAGDRPYAGTASIAGLFGTTANVDYYEFEWANLPAGPWNAMPPPAAGGFRRTYWGPQLGGGPVGFHDAIFNFTPIGGRLVIESREHFEATNDPASWGITRFWVSNRDLLMQWRTGGTFADGTYYLRLVGYTFQAGQLGPPQVLPLCDLQGDNSLVLTIDNSTSTLEPAADIVDVRINGISAGPCSNIDARNGGSLVVDFVAYDVDQHLAYYDLRATYGKNMAKNLLTAPGATLTPVGLGAIPAADFVGSDYGAARGQGATAPNWRAGGLRLTMPDLRNAFPETCCYQLELRVYKRTVVNCDHNYTPSKLSFYSLTVVV